jgi:predicted enzyme related to lactoylglutathione lyase
MTETTSPKGKFAWYEWMGDDVEAAAKFYRAVVGWNIQENNMAGFPYSIASTNGHGVAGMMKIPDDAKAMGAPPCWTGYVWVEDVDAAAKSLTAAGGSLKKRPADIPNVGRFAVVADPYGAMFMLFRDAGGNPPPPPPAGTPGLVGWRELHAGDGAGAFKFYSEQFGWKKEGEFDMGPMGIYHLFGSAPGESGGMMTRMPETPGTFWVYYFNVDAIDAAVERIKANGGQIVHGPMEVPTGQWVVQGLDPQGAFFALLAPKR